jgi:tRNA nucleotidyltransferase/poly(A) polymerase
MEMNYMLAYGSAEASLRLLWRFGLLEHLLPFQVTTWPTEMDISGKSSMYGFWFYSFD